MVLTVIAAISLRGYWRTFRPPSPDRFGKIMGKSAFAPAMTITKLTTIARTGRLIKMSVNAFILWIEERSLFRYSTFVLRHSSYESTGVGFTCGFGARSLLMA